MTKTVYIIIFLATLPLLFSIQSNDKEQYTNFTIKKIDKLLNNIKNIKQLNKKISETEVKNIDVIHIEIDDYKNFIEEAEKNIKNAKKRKHQLKTKLKKEYKINQLNKTLFHDINNKIKLINKNIHKHKQAIINYKMQLQKTYQEKKDFQKYTKQLNKYPKYLISMEQEKLLTLEINLKNIKEKIKNKIQLTEKEKAALQEQSILDTKSLINTIQQKLKYLKNKIYKSYLYKKLFGT